MTINEWLTLLVGVCSLIISYFTYKNSADTSDLQKAVSNLATLVSETHRQADAAQGQLDEMRAAQRAWLAIQDLSISTIQQFPAGVGIAVFAKYHLTNIGHSPATAIFINTGLIFRDFDQFDTNTVRSLCLPQPLEKDRRFSEYSDVMLPGQTGTIDGIGEGTLFSHTIEGVEAKWEVQLKGMENEIAQGLGKPSGTRIFLRSKKKMFYVEPTLIGCVTYKSGGEDILRKAGFAFDVKNGVSMIAFEIGEKGEVSHGPLQIIPSSIGNFPE